MKDVCPTITTDNVHTYRVQMKAVDFAHRVHIDVADGRFAPKLIDPSKAWWPAHMKADVHIMHKRPFEAAAKLAIKNPQLIIVHAEAEGQFYRIAEMLHEAGIKAGVALLPETPAGLIEPAMDIIDHVLIFSGNLGHFGGHADLSLLDKVKFLKQLKPSLEIGWDGGINEHNAKQLAEGGVDVLNAGGFIHGAEDPPAAYAKLKAKV